MNNGLMNAVEVSKMLKVGRSTVYGMVRTNKIPYVRVSPGRVMFLRRDIKALLKSEEPELVVEPDIEPKFDEPDLPMPPGRIPMSDMKWAVEFVRETNDLDQANHLVDFALVLLREMEERR